MWGGGGQKSSITIKFNQELLESLLEHAYDNLQLKSTMCLLVIWARLFKTNDVVSKRDVKISNVNF